MRRFLSLLIALCIMFSVMTSLSSCLPPIYEDTPPASGDEGDVNGGQSGGENNGNQDEGGTDSGNGGNSSQGGNDGSQDGGTDGGNGGNGSQGGNGGQDGGTESCPSGDHKDSDGNDFCDECGDYLIVVIDFYAINDLHGKFCDSASQPGVDELGTYFENRAKADDHVVLLSSGDMWQGAAESVLTQGKIMVDWMNELGFAAMTLGNHEFDWGEEAIRENALLAEFPFLAINVYNKSTGRLADYCTPSVIVECGGAKVGIIGAIGDCYSSISSDMVTDVYFKVKDELTALVKAESERLRAAGADLIIYSLHDGSDDSSSASHYNTVLSEGYVDLVFEGHTHQSYIKIDSQGIIHIQGGGENSGLSHVELGVHLITGATSVNEKNIVTSSTYAGLEDHLATEAIEDKYSEIIEYAYSILGTVSKKYSSDALADYVAELYLKAGIKRWGEQYDVVYGGGFLQTRSPYDLSAGEARYADVLSLLPFNNRITLCKISGANLRDRLINNSKTSYHEALAEGFSVANINPSGIYYVVVDTYTALYRYNSLTIVDYYDETTYARDLLADAIRAGELGSAPIVRPDGQYTLTPISHALSEGDRLAEGGETSEYLYYRGTVKSVTSPKYGNCYLVDENGDEIYVYGLHDINGNLYEVMDNPPREGDVIIVYAAVKKYKNYNTGEVIVELINSIVVAVNPET